MISLVRPSAFAGLLTIALACLASAAEPSTKPGEPLPRRGDEIVACGQLFHTTTKVVLWTDPGGYDAYRLERRFPPKNSGQAAKDETGQVGFGARRVNLAEADRERLQASGWDLPLLQKAVDQFVIHYDVCGTSRRCFQVLHDERHLSVHFMLDLDGTIYQTLDLKENAWHATIANSRSIGIEIANMGAYPVGGRNPFAEYYATDKSGGVRLLIPQGETEGKDLGPNWIPRPARPKPIVGTIQGQKLEQYDLTPEQYEALTRLTATLCRVFPRITCDYPRDASGQLIPQKLPDDVYKQYHGVLGHYHVQTNKTDPGPAFQWDKVIGGARGLIGDPSKRD